MLARSPGPLTLTPAFTVAARRMLAYRALVGDPSRAHEVQYELPLLAVTDVEEALGARLHDELIALLVLGFPKGSRLPDLFDLRAAARKRGLPSAWLPLAPDAAFVTPLRADPKEGLRVAAWKPADGSVEMAVAAPRWMERWLDQSMAEREVDEAVSAQIEQAGAGPLDILLTTAPPPEAPPPVRVQHAKFGLGTVLTERDGKVEVAFDDGQTRTFLERFIQRL
jgi:hypothetical protein